MPATIAIGPQDELLRLTGSAGNPFETVNTTGNGTGKWFGANRTFRLRALVAGTVTGTSATLDVKVQDSADGTTYTDMGISFSQITTTSAVATGSLTAAQSRTVTTVAGRPYVRIVKTVAGTTPVFNSFAVLVDKPEPF